MMGGQESRKFSGPSCRSGHAIGALGMAHGHLVGEPSGEKETPAELRLRDGSGDFVVMVRWKVKPCRQMHPPDDQARQVGAKAQGPLST